MLNPVVSGRRLVSAPEVPKVVETGSGACSVARPERPPPDFPFLLVPACLEVYPHSPVTDEEGSSASLLGRGEHLAPALALSPCDCSLLMKYERVGPDGFM